MGAHIHIGFGHALMTALEVLLFLIPLKLIAAHFTGKSATADAAFGIL